MLWLGRPGLVAATGSWLASSDYLPKVKSGQMARVLPIYLKLRKGFQRRSLVDCSPASKNTKGKQSAVVVRLNWAMFLELVNRCAAGAAADSDEEEGAEGRGTTEGELGVHGEPEPESDGLMVMGSKDVAAPVPLPLFLQLLAQSLDATKWKYPPPAGFTGSKLDKTTQTKYFRVPGGATAQNDEGCTHCCEPCAAPAKAGGVMAPFMVNPNYNWTEIWFDDGSTIGKKYKTVEKAGCRGLAFWTAGATQHDPAVISDMWGAVKPW